MFTRKCSGKQYATPFLIEDKNASLCEKEVGREKATRKDRFCWSI